MTLWMKRAIGVAALGGGLLALSAGAASAQQASADVRLGRPTSAEVRVCADGLSRLVGSCSSSARTSATVRAGRNSDGTGGVRASARVPGLASADVSLGTRRSRPRTVASGQVSSVPRSAAAQAAADTSPRARANLLVDLRPLASAAGVGLLGSSPFTLVGDPATGTLLPTGELSLLDGAAGGAPAGIGVVDSGPIASGNQVDLDVGDVSPSVPVTVCGNSVGVLGDASAGCGTSQQGASTGSAGSGPSASAGTSGGSASDGSLLGNLASGNQVDAGIGDISPSVPLNICGNSAGVLGDASASCGAPQPAPGNGSSPGSSPTEADLPLSIGTAGTSVLVDAGSTEAEVSIGTGSADIPASTGSTEAGATVGTGSTDASVTVGTGSTEADVSLGIGTSGTSVPVGTGSTDAGGSAGTGDTGVDVSIGADISTGGIIAPAPGTSSPEEPSGQTGTDGTIAPPGTTGTTGTTGLSPGTGGDLLTDFAPRRPFVSSSGSALPFTGAASDLLAAVAAGLLAAGALFLRATRPAAAREGGDDR